MASSLLRHKDWGLSEYSENGGKDEYETEFKIENHHWTGSIDSTEIHLQDIIRLPGP